MVVARVSTGTDVTRQAMITVDSDCLAANTLVRADYRYSKTQADGDANSSFVHLVADAGQCSASSQSPEPGEGAANRQVRTT